MGDEQKHTTSKNRIVGNCRTSRFSGFGVCTSRRAIFLLQPFFLTTVLSLRSHPTHTTCHNKMEPKHVSLFGEKLARIP